MADRIEHLFHPSDLKEYNDFLIVIYPPAKSHEQPVYATLGDLVKRIVSEISKENENDC